MALNALQYSFIEKKKYSFSKLFDEIIKILRKCGPN